jgi:uncharacterized protein YeaO (DUF488 family)
MGQLRIARIYDPAEPGEFRVLVDRLWPRGVARDRVDLWLKDAAPSPALRVYFDHQAGRFAEFSEQYRSELAGSPVIEQIRQLAGHHGKTVLLYGSKDRQINHAVVLLAVVNEAAPTAR